jgi:hypothetical protein
MVEERMDSRIARLAVEACLEFWQQPALRGPPALRQDTSDEGMSS